MTFHPSVIANAIRAEQKQRFQQWNYDTNNTGKGVALMHKFSFDCFHSAL